MILVSGGDRLRAYGSQSGAPAADVPLDGVGALCAGGADVFCAARGDMLWRLGARDLQPRALFAGGPCMRDVKLSGDGRRLYSLSSGADSVLLLDAADGAPLVLARAGCNPPRMALDEAENVLAVAGGRQEAVLLLDAHTLAAVGRFSAPGPVCDVAIAGGCIYALCAGEERKSALVVWRGGKRTATALEGMAGALLARTWGVLAATQEALFAFGADGTCARLRRMTGCPSRLALDGGRLCWIDRFCAAALAMHMGCDRSEILCLQAAGLAAFAHTMPDTRPT